MANMEPSIMNTIPLEFGENLPQVFPNMMDESYEEEGKVMSYPLHRQNSYKMIIDPLMIA